jgi:GNAT superfamily N-acetyltransferase
MIIREIEQSELEDLLTLYADLHDSDDPLPGRSVVFALWDRIKADPNQKYYGAFEQDRLVSSCVLMIVPNLTRGCRPYGIIENVVTHHDFRRKGLGKAVLAVALEHAWEQNCYKVMLLTGRKTEVVFSFYESAGFDRYAKQAFLARPPRRRNGQPLEKK